VSGDEQGGPRAELDDLAEEMRALGLTEHVDFYIPGRLPGTLPSSEHIGMWATPEGAYEVWYRDMGSSDVLLVSDDFREARDRFVREAVALARGRGARITDPGVQA